MRDKDIWLERFEVIFDALLQSGMDAGEAADKAALKADEEIREAEMHHADMANEERRVA